MYRQVKVNSTKTKRCCYSLFCFCFFVFLSLCLFLGVELVATSAIFACHATLKSFTMLEEINFEEEFLCCLLSIVTTRRQNENTASNIIMILALDIVYLMQLAWCSRSVFTVHWWLLLKQYLQLLTLKCVVFSSFPRSLPHINHI